MNLAFKLNPLLAYLLKQKRISYGPQLALILVAWAISLVPMAAILSTFGQSAAPFLCVAELCLFAYPVVMFAPTATGVYSAMPMFSATQSTNHEMIMLTSISDRTIVWSYVAVAIYRLRWLLTLVAATAPMTLFMVLVLLGFTSMNTYATCVQTVIGNVYCGRLDAASASIGSVGDQELVVIWALVFAIVGNNLLTGVIGAILNIYQRNRALTFVATAGVSFFLSGVVGLIVVNEFLLKTLVLRRIDLPTLISLVFITVLPYAAAVGLVRLTSRLVRGPA